MIYIKFGKKEHLESFRNEGIIYMNTFQYFKNCEDKKKGDPNEYLLRIRLKLLF